MTDAEDTIQTLRRLVIDTKDELMHARYRLDGLDPASSKASQSERGDERQPGDFRPCR